MPMPNYHAARVRDPGEFDKVVVLQTLSNGVMIYGGALKGKPSGGSTAQSYRFPASKFTLATAKKWLKDNNIKTILFEPASGNGQESIEGFLECVTDAFQGCEFVEAENTIRNVVLLGPVSKNKRRYTEDAMRKAPSLYEGRKCFLNHATMEELMGGGRHVERIAGKFVNVRFDESDKKLRADAVLLKGDPAAQKFLNIAQQMPEVAGLSHNAMGRMKHDKATGEDVVEEITKVISVDLVAEPATTQGMYESTNQEQENTMDWEGLTIDDLKKHRHDIYEGLIAEGGKGRDEEVNKLKEDAEKLQKENDELKVKEATREKEAVVTKMIGESGLPEHAVTDFFRKMCLNAKPSEGQKFEEAVAEVIKDRKEALEATGVKGMGGEQKRTTDKSKIDNAKVEEALKL